ncbi:MAG: hypothetical protein AB7L91_17830 [Dehalococcoidia bacterium]
MKITLDLPAELVRRVRAQAAREGRSVGDLTATLYRSWLSEPVDRAGRGETPSGLRRWLTEAPALMRGPIEDGVTAQTLLDEGRNRLEQG